MAALGCASRPCRRPRRRRRWRSFTSDSSQRERRASITPLLLIGCYVFDFLAIHPFRDGNGRMARLLTLLLLYQSGYGVGRFISLERLVSDSRESYYEALEASGHGWHEDGHDAWPWLEYRLGILLAAYAEFERRVSLLGEGRGAKSAAIETSVRSTLSDELTIADVRDAALGA